jgi:hypothetical protein
MSVLQYEQSPQIELTHGLKLTPVEIARLTAANASAEPGNSFQEALSAYRTYAIRHARDELLNKTVVEEGRIRTTLDMSWQLFAPAFKKATGAMIAEAYIRAFRAVEEGTLPIQLIYALANEHADRVGKYFNETSTEALIQGFNTYVNRQVPQRAAVERVLDAYGLTPRQMSGYTSADQLAPSKIASASPRNLKRKLKSYIGKSIADRLGVFQRQEAHNLDMQAKQVAWMWMVENRKLPASTQKMWLTAKDEKVCVQCGPMNGAKVDVGSKFELPNGNELFVPGAHVNCRCQVRLQINPFSEVGKAEDFEPRAHPRHPKGAPGGRGGEFMEAEEIEATEQLQEMVRQAREQAAQAPPPKPFLDIPAVTKPTIDVPRARPSLDIPAAEQPAAPVSKPSLDIPAPVARPVEKPVIDIAPTPAPSIDVPKPVVDVDVARLERLIDERQTAEFSETLHPTVFSPTRKITDAHNNAVRGYVIVGGEQMSHWKEGLTLTDDDEVRILSEAERSMWIRRGVRDKYDENITTYHQRLMGGAAFIEIDQQYEDETDEPERTVTTEVSSAVVLEAIRRASMMPDPDEDNMDIIPLDHEAAPAVAWADPDTGEIAYEEEMSWRDLIGYLGIDPEEYEVVLVEIDEAYSDAVPLVENESWRTPGDYQSANQDKTFMEFEGRVIPYRRVKAVPNVREDTFLTTRRPGLPHDRH